MGEKDFSDRAFVGDDSLSFVSRDVFRAVRAGVTDPIERAGLVADLCRINTLFMIMQAGSGHIGSSFSSTDLITWLWTEALHDPNGDSENADVYFSSKGHDVPALYSLLIAIEKLGFDLLPKLRQLNGLPGHPDVSTPFIAANTGSLGMGISKAYGMARANRYQGRSGRIVVMTGDGELQEGQIWESLQPCANERLADITVIVDHNKFQSDTAVAAVSDLGDLEAKFRIFGWEVRRGDGHDFAVMRDAFAHFATVTDKPKVFIADTIKGKGVSFMEGIACGDQTYHFHAGAPSLENYVKATRELIARVNARLEALGQPPAVLTSAPLPVRISPKNPEKIVLAYGDELLEMARHRPEIIVMDADLLSDCGIEAFKAELPERFIECGIAEMHMVSAAGGMALRGMLPVVHSFACFLSTRANEHIYNNATEKKRIIYTATLAGLVPGGPGHSHQSVRDISAIGAVPGLVAFEPCSEKEARLAIRWAVEQNPDSTYLRFVNVPLDLPYTMPADYALQVGHGVTLRAGTDVAIIGYGTILLTNACRAADELATQGISAAVIDLPWLNRIDDAWVKTLGAYKRIVTLDNHYLEFGQGVMIAAALARNGVRSDVSAIGLTEIPACGSNVDVLAYHGLDAAGIARTVMAGIPVRKMNYPKTVPHWIADVEVTPKDTAFFEKRNPATDQVIAQVARGGAAEVAHALSSAAGAADGWGRTPVPKRGAILGRAAQLLREREQLFGEIVQAETGKPWKNAVAEVGSSADLAVFMEGEGSRLYGKTLPSPIPNRTVQTLRSPIGICAAIMPFNSPLAGVAWKAFPALLCGNAVVVKSHELTPYTAVAFGQLLKDAGLPVGVYSAVQGFGPDAGAPLVQDHRVGVVSFTGSSATGKLIQKMVSDRGVLAKVCLELGGKNPFVVCDDADLELAAELAVASAFIDAGQRCASGSRIIVFDKIYDAFRAAFLARVAKVKVGSGPDDDCGPVISRASLDRLIAQVSGAVSRGATLVTGGHAAASLAPGAYMQPTVLENVSPADDVSQQELFGPVTCLYRVAGFDEAIRLANGTHYGLTGAIHTTSLHRSQEFITRYQGGLVSINGATFGSGPHMPFGGVKNPGNGFREPGTEALDVYTELKTVVINHVPGKV